MVWLDRESNSRSPTLRLIKRYCNFNFKDLTTGFEKIIKRMIKGYHKNHHSVELWILRILPWNFNQQLKQWSKCTTKIITLWNFNFSDLTTEFQPITKTMIRSSYNIGHLFQAQPVLNCTINIDIFLLTKFYSVK